MQRQYSHHMIFSTHEQSAVDFESEFATIERGMRIQSSQGWKKRRKHEYLVSRFGIRGVRDDADSQT